MSKFAFFHADKNFWFWDKYQDDIINFVHLLNGDDNNDEIAKFFETIASRELAQISLLKPKVCIFVEGNIGAGKTTLINKLTTDHGDKLVQIPEPLNFWTKIINVNATESEGKNIFECFYKALDSPLENRHVFLFELTALFSRFLYICYHLRYVPSNLFICERSFIADRYFFNIYIFFCFYIMLY